MPTNIANSTNIQTISSATQVVAKTASSSPPKQSVAPLPGSGSHAEPARQILPAGNVSASSAEVKVAVEKLNTQILSLQRDLSFSVDEDSGRTVVRVIDSETGDVVRQIPTEQVLKLARQIDVILSEVGDQLSGILLEEQA